MLTLHPADGTLMLQSRLRIVDGVLSRTDDENLPEETIDGFPALAAGLARHDDRIEQATPDGHVLWLPIRINDKVSICFEITSNRPYDAHALEVIQGILHVYRNFLGLLNDSERDSLTGLLNRKTFDDNFSRLVSSGPGAGDGAVEAPDRRRPSLERAKWLAVVDIDHFKRVNDRFGHVYGDEVLLMISGILQRSFRSNDRVFRFGGEEFVILLRSATLDEARNALSRFRAAVEQHSFPQVGKITVSIGFAEIGAETPVAILGHADRAMYYAKSNGRNQVCHFNELVERGELQPEAASNSMEFF